MRSRSRFSFFRRTVVAAVIVSALAACGGTTADLGSERLEALPSGATRAQVLEALGTGPLTATGYDEVRLVNGYRTEGFLANGQRYDIVWYRQEPGTLDDRVTRETETPVVLQADTLLGWGWTFFEEWAATNNMPNPLLLPPPPPPSADTTGEPDSAKRVDL